MAEEKNEKNENQEADEKKDGSEEMKDRLLRLAAEFDNYKKRIAKELENSKKVARAELVIKLLPVLDEIELAVENLDMKTDHEKGIALVLSNLKEALKKEGLAEIECEGIYDPYKHEIMMTKESDEEDGTILNVVRKGYFLNGIMLRPASVIVSKGSKEKEEIEKE